MSQKLRLLARSAIPRTNAIILAGWKALAGKDDDR